jgi:malate dehydrogenase (oxaloacetate-decarboxylating)(NADP+)
MDFRLVFSLSRRTAIFFISINKKCIMLIYQKLYRRGPPKMSKQQALDYHRYPFPGKINIGASTSLSNQADLALAYSPGVAEPCLAIHQSPETVFDYTSRGNLIGVISNGTAVLGLGNIGPLASKPVMEGKAILFKSFGGINAFDLEIAETDVNKFCDIVAALEPTFGGINLEDIKAPECFAIEENLRKRMKIPVFHDDQHGTAIVVAAAVTNALQLVDKPFSEVKLVVSGAGAAAMACTDLLVDLGLMLDNILMLDSLGVIHDQRVGLDSRKQRYARDTQSRSLADAIHGSDLFLGLSQPDLVSAEMLKSMAARPIILALSNPDPEVSPDLVQEYRPDAIMATGRSDFPNQVNNVLCFPFLFRGALDVGATEINVPMKIACVRALAKLAQAEVHGTVKKYYPDDSLIGFGRRYILPKPFDPRLIGYIAPAVAQAAVESGVATRPYSSLENYRESLVDGLGVGPYTL